MKTITAIIATRAKNYKEFQLRPIFKSLQKQEGLIILSSHESFRYNVFYDNQKGLSQLYNECLSDKCYKDDILLFVHDDVELEDIFLTEKLQNSPYMVSGLAGCKQADTSKPPAWHLMSERNTHVGEVAHTAHDKIWTTTFGPTHTRALLVDGLFLAVDVAQALEKNIKFDNDFTFHHYDIAFCLNCNKQKATVGVLPIRVVHHGLGDSMLTPEWKDSAVLFSKKYGNGTFTGKNN